MKFETIIAIANKLYSEEIIQWNCRAACGTERARIDCSSGESTHTFLCRTLDILEDFEDINPREVAIKFSDKHTYLELHQSKHYDTSSVTCGHSHTASKTIHNHVADENTLDEATLDMIFAQQDCDHDWVIHVGKDTVIRKVCSKCGVRQTSTILNASGIFNSQQQKEFEGSEKEFCYSDGNEVKIIPPDLSKLKCYLDKGIVKIFDHMVRLPPSTHEMFFCPVCKFTLSSRQYSQDAGQEGKYHFETGCGNHLINEHRAKIIDMFTLQLPQEIKGSKQEVVS